MGASDWSQKLSLCNIGSKKFVSLLTVGSNVQERGKRHYRLSATDSTEPQAPLRVQAHTVALDQLVSTILVWEHHPVATIVRSCLECNKVVTRLPTQVSTGQKEDRGKRQLAASQLINHKVPSQHPLATQR